MHQQHLFQRVLPVGTTVSIPGEKVRGADIPIKDGPGRELIREPDQRGFQLIAKTGLEVAEGALKHAGVLQLILAKQDAHDLVQQGHGLDVGGRNRLGATGGHLRGEQAGRGKIGQTKATIRLEQGFIELVFLSGAAGDEHIGLNGRRGFC